MHASDLLADGSYLGSRFGPTATSKHSRAASRDASQTSIHADSSRHARRGIMHTQNAEQRDDTAEAETAGFLSDRLFPDTAEGHMAMVSLPCAASTCFEYTLSA